VTIATAPYPGFATDMQAQLMALLCKADGQHVVSAAVRKVEREPAFCTANGKVLLAGLEPADLLKYADSVQFHAYTTKTICSKVKLLRELEKVRQQGYALDLEEFAKDLCCVGVPVFGIIYPIVVGTLLFFAFPLVLFRDMDAMSALKESMAKVKPNFMNFLLLWLACGALFLVAEIVGLILCLIGVLVTIPVAMCVMVMVQLEAYRDTYGLNPENLDQYR